MLNLRTGDSANSKPGLETLAKISTWALFLISILAGGLGFVFLPSTEIISNSIFSGSIILIVVVGILILSRSSSSRIGWLLVVIGVLVSIVNFSVIYTRYAFLSHPDIALPFRWPAAWIQSWTWYPIAGLIAIVFPQVFPTGEPLPLGWRSLFRFSVVWLILGSLIVAFAIDPLSGVVEDLNLRNPYAVISIPTDSPIAVPLLSTLLALLIILILLAFASMVVRFRRSRGDERQQIKWVVLAMGLWASILAFDFARLPFVSSNEVLDLVSTLLSDLAFIALPVAIGLSILKYRLYDIDLLIKRTLVYSILTLLLGLIYFVSVLVLQRTFTAESSIAVVLSTLAIAALFSPLRRQVQIAIDKRFYRQRYNAQQTLVTFSADLQDQIDAEELSESLISVIGETLQPEHVSIWLRKN
jgi:hypothetical protein